MARLLAVPAASARAAPARGAVASGLVSAAWALVGRAVMVAWVVRANSVSRVFKAVSGGWPLPVRAAQHLRGTGPAAGAITLQPFDRSDVKMIGWLIEQEDVGI